MVSSHNDQWHAKHFKINRCRLIFQFLPTNFCLWGDKKRALLKAPAWEAIDVVVYTDVDYTSNDAGSSPTYYFKL